jgi:hypothetical protein
MPNKLFDRSFTILSAERSGRIPEANRLATIDMESELASEGIPYIRVDGVYKGDAERSFLVPDLGVNPSILHHMARAFNQDTILVYSPIEDDEREETGQAWLVNLRSYAPFEFIGYLVELPQQIETEAEAIASGRSDGTWLPSGEGFTFKK